MVMDFFVLGLYYTKAISIMVFAYFVMRTANTMNLEDQANLKKRIETAIKEMAEALKNEMPKV
jgi:ABC-type transporter MlaC component